MTIYYGSYGLAGIASSACNVQNFRGFLCKDGADLRIESFSCKKV